MTRVTANDADQPILTLCCQARHRAANHVGIAGRVCGRPGTALRDAIFPAYAIFDRPTDMRAIVVLLAGGTLMSGPAQRPVLAALLMCATTIAFTIHDTILKTLVVDHGVGMLVTIRLGVQVVLMLALVPWFGQRALRIKLPLVQVGRGLPLIAGAALAALSVRYVSLAQTYAIGFSAPLIAALIAAVMLAERPGWRQVLCILVGFFGVVAALDPGAPTFSLALLLPLALACSNATLHVLTRLGRSEEPIAAVLWSAIVAFVIAFVALPWTFEVLSPGVWAWQIAAGVFATAGQLFMVEAFRRAPTAVVSPIVYAQFIWSAISGILVFGDIPGVGVVFGALVVALSGIALVWWATPKPPPIYPNE